MTNPQNAQFYGTPKNPYPLEAGEFHRFIIPNYKNEVSGTDLSLWIGETQIPCEFGISNGKLFRITFISDEKVSGRFEIKSGGITIFWSNCVSFVDSNDGEGRKYIRIATKHTYNRHLFAYDESNFDWIITNLPAYNLGIFNVEAEISNDRVGGNNTLKTNETYLDEAVQYQFITHGDANILGFIQVHSTNNFFYIDGTQRTAVDKLDAHEFSIHGKMRFVNVKDGNGLNVIFDEKEIFKDVIRYVLSDNNKTKIYTYNNNQNAIPTDGRYS